ncbi:tachykinin-like peptides receptor 99D [Patiria miniata]|uniref:G-protein coupled receptors family 1 profile domain-containing protein n=1 Tax=Patiria miniata TaxID=46514 RepID=A0A914ASS7_PATMI|nr:tachykinin-like peptides receptor 99D [Patiria miniata]
MGDLYYNQSFLTPTGESTNGSGETDAANMVVLAMFGVICAVGVAGNLLVCIVLLRVPSLRSNTSDFLVHLSLVDLAVCALVVPLKIVLPLIQPMSPSPNVWGQFRCRVYEGQYPFWVCALTSVFSLVTVNLERFVAIVHPHKYKRIFGNRRNKLFIILSCWVLAALCKCFIVFLYDEDPVLGCRFLNWPTFAWQAGMGMFNFTVNLLAPFVVMVWVQLKVISMLKKQVRTLSGRFVSWDQGLPPADRRKMWQLRATQTLARTLLAFVLTFAVCWFPDQFMFLLYSFGVPLSFTSTVYHFGVILAVCNSCVNPIIYTMTNQQFRKGIKMAFCKRNSGRVGDAANTSRVITVVT